MTGAVPCRQRPATDRWARERKLCGAEGLHPHHPETVCWSLIATRMVCRGAAEGVAAVLAVVDGVGEGVSEDVRLGVGEGVTEAVAESLEGDVELAGVPSLDLRAKPTRTAVRAASPTRPAVGTRGDVQRPSAWQLTRVSWAMAEAGTGLNRSLCLSVRLPCSPTAPEHARRHSARILVEWGSAGVGDDPRCAQKGYAGSANQ